MQTPDDAGRVEGSHRRNSAAARSLDLTRVMLVRDLMQADVATLKAHDHLDLADDIMRLGRIRHMPVVDGDRVVGIVSQRDLFRAAISSVLRLRPAAEREWLAKIAVREVMSTEVISVTPDTTIRTAVGRMIEKRIGCLPVVENGRLVGLLSETDCLGHLAKLLDIADARGQLTTAAFPD
jgi:acetoin utilization protein AcuB